MDAIQKCLPDKKILKERLNMVLWLMSYFVFILVGGILITTIEEENDKAVKNTKRLNLLAGLRRYNISSNSAMILKLFELAVDAADVGGLNLENLEEEVPSSWGFGSGLFFCSTIVTTIGYGNMFPITVGGRWFVIFYAFIGIPLTAIILGKIGARLTELIKRMDSTLTKSIGKVLGKLRAEKKMKSYVRIIQIIILVFLFMLFFWIIPAIIMTQTEDWDINTSIYYCFITITTIGLGDVVPGVSNAILDFHAMAKKVSTVFYFILGLSALSIIMNLSKSLFDLFAAVAIETAEDISDIGKTFAGNMAGSMKDKIYRGRKIHPESTETMASTDIDEPEEETLGDIPEENTDDTDLTLDAMLNTESEQPTLKLGFDDDNQLVLCTGDDTDGTPSSNDEKALEDNNEMPDVVVK